MQQIYTNSESLIQLEQLGYRKVYSNLSTLKVMDGQQLRSDQPQMWWVTTDRPVGADAGKKERLLNNRCHLNDNDFTI